MNINQIINNLILYDSNKEWVEINYRRIDTNLLGETISALSNVAALNHKEYGYLILGIDPLTFQSIGTDFNPSKKYLSKTYKRTIEKYLKPKINVRFDYYLDENNRRVVILYIKAAKEIPTSFKNKKYIKVGNIKTELKFYPKKLNELYRVLNTKEDTLYSKSSLNKNLTFKKLFLFYSYKDIYLNKNTFLKDLNLIKEDKTYNYLGELLSDETRIYINLSIYKGRNKSSELIITKEFKYNNLLLLLEELINYGSSINFNYIDHQYNETPLFSMEDYKDILVFSFLNNSWSKGENIEIEIYLNRIEIFIKGVTLDSISMKDLINGEYNPLNRDLYLILESLNYIDPYIPLLSNVVSKYGQNSIKSINNNLIITLPFNQLNSKKYKASEELTGLENLILKEIRTNKEVRIQDLMKLTNKSKAWVERNIKFLKEKGYITRVGSRKNGVWRELN